MFFKSKIEKRAGRGDSLVVHDVELSFSERRRHFVLYDLDARPIARNDAVRLFDGSDAANIDAHTRVKLQCLAAGRRFRITKHDADLLADLIGKNAARPGL